MEAFLTVAFFVVANAATTYGVLELRDRMTAHRIRVEDERAAYEGMLRMREGLAVKKLDQRSNARSVPADPPDAGVYPYYERDDDR